MFTDCDGLTGYGMIVTQAYQLASVSVVRMRETTSPAAGVARANRTSPISTTRTTRNAASRASSGPTPRTARARKGGAPGARGKVHS